MQQSSIGAHYHQPTHAEPSVYSVINLTTTHEGQIWQSNVPLTVDLDSVEVPPYLPDTPLVRQDIASLPIYLD